MKFLRILVPVTGQESDREAVELACKVTKEAKGKVYVVHVIEVKRSLPLDADLKLEAQRAEEILSHAVEVADEQNYQVETDLLQARDVGPAIIEEAIERGADLIIMGMSYRKRFGQFALGNVMSVGLEQIPLGSVISKGIDQTALGSAISKRFGQFALDDTVSYVLQNAPCRVLLLHNLLAEGEK